VEVGEKRKPIRKGKVPRSAGRTAKIRGRKKKDDSTRNAAEEGGGERGKNSGKNARGEWKAEGWIPGKVARRGNRAR